MFRSPQNELIFTTLVAVAVVEVDTEGDTGEASAEEEGTTRTGVVAGESIVL